MKQAHTVPVQPLTLSNPSAAWQLRLTNTLMSAPMVRRPGSSGHTMQVLSPEIRPNYPVEDIEFSPVAEDLEV